MREPNHFDEAIKWARVFAGAKSMTSRCIRRRESKDENSAGAAQDGDDMDRQPSADVGGPGAAPTPVPAEGAHLRQLTMDLLSSFVEALETAPARLHDKER